MKGLQLLAVFWSMEFSFMFVIRVRWPTYWSTPPFPFLPVILEKKTKNNPVIINKLSFLGLYSSCQWCDLHAQKGTILAGLSLSTTPSSEESLLQIRSSLGNAISTFHRTWVAYLLLTFYTSWSSQACYWVPRQSREYLLLPLWCKTVLHSWAEGQFIPEWHCSHFAGTLVLF